MPLYQIKQQKVNQIKPSSFKNERELQKLFEANLEALLGVRFVASEFTTGDRQRGRIDSLGIDQDGTPVIVEYKKRGKKMSSTKDCFISTGWLIIKAISHLLPSRPWEVTLKLIGQVQD